MYLTQQDIARTHEGTLENLFTATQAYVSASEKFANLFWDSSRAALAAARDQAETEASFSPSATAGTLNSFTHPWFARWQNQSARLLRDSLKIIGDTHQSTLHVMESQFKVVDAALTRSLQHASSFAPAEGELALSALRKAIDGAEITLTSLTDASVNAVILLEDQIRHVSEGLTEPGKAASQPAEGTR